MPSVQANINEVSGENSSDFVIRAGTLVKYNGTSAEVIIPNTVIEIGDGAFSDCSSLTSVIIPDGVRYIGEISFWDCSSLTNVAMPDSVALIGNLPFVRCDNLKSLTIPVGAWCYDQLITADLQSAEFEILKWIPNRLFGYPNCNLSLDFELNGIKIFELLKEKEAATKVSRRIIAAVRNILDRFVNRPSK